MISPDLDSSSRPRISYIVLLLIGVVVVFFVVRRSQKDALIDQRRSPYSDQRGPYSEPRERFRAAAVAAATAVGVGTYLRDEAGAPVHWLPVDSSLLLTGEGTAAEDDIVFDNLGAHGDTDTTSNSRAGRPVPRVHLLLLGDSVDRQIVTDGCGVWPDTVGGLEWGRGVFAYADPPHDATARCEAAWGSASFLHLFGSRPRGPYYEGRANSPADSFVDTPARIQRGLVLYTELFNEAPTLVLFQCGLWDVELAGGGAHQRGSSLTVGADVAADRALDLMRNFTVNMHALVNQLLDALPPTSLLVLRTTPLARNYLWQAELNAALRGVAATAGVGVLDWDAWTRGEAAFGTNLFRDFHHPTPALSRDFLVTLVRFARRLATRTGS